jgi:hypothetical protein
MNMQLRYLRGLSILWGIIPRETEFTLRIRKKGSEDEFYNRNN